MNRIISRQTATLAGLAAVALGLALAAGAALASDNTPLYSTAVGKATYATYCASCHGADLRGKESGTSSSAASSDASPASSDRLAGR